MSRNRFRTGEGPCRVRVLLLVCTALLISIPLLRAGGDGNDLLPDIPDGPIAVRLTEVVDLPFIISDIETAGDGSGRLFVMLASGSIVIVEGGLVLPTPFLDEPTAPLPRSMLGITFHPNFASNGKVYVATGEALPGSATPHFVPPQDLTASAYDAVLEEFQVDATDPDRLDPATRRELLRIRQPHSAHNLNDLVFGPDGYLYLAVGDGGDTRTGTPISYEFNADDLSNPYGSILRIDVNTLGTNGRYGIPADNPFAGVGPVEEIYCWGLRNPWRITCDPVTGTIFAAVNGDFTIEWVVPLMLGLDYGWPTREGSFLWDPATGDASVDPAPDPALTGPLAEYDHNTGGQPLGSIIGGPVYRGSDFPSLYGRYIFGDWLGGELFAMDPSTGAILRLPIDPTGETLGVASVVTIGRDAAGEIYLGTMSGQLLRMEPVATPASSFRRGDGNVDGVLDLADAIFNLGVLFTGFVGVCDDALDGNDDGTHDVADAVFLLGSIFGFGPPPPAPTGACGGDPTGDALGCADGGCP